jgi:hypothetical protein
MGFHPVVCERRMDNWNEIKRFIHFNILLNKLKFVPIKQTHITEF